MAKKKYEEANIQSIADAIREKTGTDDTYKTSEMASGVNEVYEAGKKTAYDEFWDNLQNYGKRTVYDRTFEYWAGEYFRPKYKIVPNSYPNAQHGFYRWMQASVNLKKIEKAYIDLSKAELPTGSSSMGWRQTFQNCKNLQVVEDIGMQPALYYYTFNGCYDLSTIEVLRFAENTQESSAFTNCNLLENITIEGTIGRNLSFSSCPLSIDSLKSVITHLKNYSGTDNEYTYKLTLSSESKALLEEEGATSPNGNLWSDYIDDLGWTLK